MRKGAGMACCFLVAEWDDVCPRGLKVFGMLRVVRVHVINGKYKGAGKRDELCDGAAPGMGMCCGCMYL